MRVTIADTLSWELPVVSTGVGTEGVNFKDAEDSLIADSPEEFADAVLMLLQIESTPEIWQKLVENQ